MTNGACRRGDTIWELRTSTNFFWTETCEETPLFRRVIEHFFQDSCVTEEALMMKEEGRKSESAMWARLESKISSNGVYIKHLNYTAFIFHIGVTH